MWSLFKINSKETRKTSVTLFWCQSFKCVLPNNYFETFQKIQRKTHVSELYTGWNFTKQYLWHRHLSVNFTKFPGTAHLRNIYMLLNLWTLLKKLITKTAVLTPYYIFCWLWTIFTHCSIVIIFDLTNPELTFQS